MTSPGAGSPARAGVAMHREEAGLEGQAEHPVTELDSQGP